MLTRKIKPTKFVRYCSSKPPEKLEPIEYRLKNIERQLNILVNDKNLQSMSHKNICMVFDDFCFALIIGFILIFIVFSIISFSINYHTIKKLER